MKSIRALFLIVTILSSILTGAQQSPQQKAAISSWIDDVRAGKEPENLLQKLENFSWIDNEKTIGGMALPTNMAQIQNLKNQNVGTIITLTEMPLSKELIDSAITYVHIPIKDFKAPTNDQIIAVINAIEQAHAAGKAAVIHCRAGIGRTGTLLACWLVKNQELSPNDALNTIRSLRPGSVETKEQENAIETYRKSLQKANVPTTAPAEPAVLATAAEAPAPAAEAATIEITGFFLPSGNAFTNLKDAQTALNTLLSQSNPKGPCTLSWSPNAGLNKGANNAPSNSQRKNGTFYVLFNGSDADRQSFIQAVLTFNITGKANPTATVVS